MLQFAITGETELARAVAGLPAAIERNAAFEALVIALLPVIEAAKLHVPVDSGDLRRAIGFRIKKYRHTILGIVGALRGQGTDGREPANYAHLVEFGHRVAAGGKLDRLDGRHVKRGVFEAKGVEVGFVPPHPFLRPAWEEKKAEVLAVLRREFGERLVAEVRRRQDRAARTEASVFAQWDRLQQEAA